MARPKLAVSPERLLEAFHTTGSLRGASKVLGISRWAVGERLKELGVPIPTKEQAMATVRLVAEQRTTYRIRVETQRWGSSTVYHRFHRIPYTPCILPGCTLEVYESNLCRKHRPLLEEQMGCVWPGCPQHSCGPFCYAHDKTLRGLMSA